MFKVSEQPKMPTYRNQKNPGQCQLLSHLIQIWGRGLRQEERPIFFNPPKLDMGQYSVVSWRHGIWGWPDVALALFLCDIGQIAWLFLASVSSSAKWDQAFCTCSVLGLTVKRQRRLCSCVLTRLSEGDRQQIKTVTANSVKCSEENKNRLMK